jgi:CBS domain-containing protein
VTPFDTLSREELSQMVSQMEIAYYPRGEVIIRRGDEPSPYLYVVHVGSARITLTDDAREEILVDVRGEGDVFGALSLLEGSQALFDVTAQEDLIAYLLPAEAFKALVDQHPVFQRYFSYSLARNIRAVAGSADGQLPRLAGITDFNIDSFLMGKQVADLMVADVLTCDLNTSIRAAAQRMAKRRVGSILIKGKDGPPLGIVTDADLRVKVLAAGHPPDAPVEDVMSQPLHTIPSQSYAFDALLEMSRQGVSHLLVTEDDRLVGIISEHDFQMEVGSSPIGVIGDIDKSQSVEELLSTRARIDQVREMLLRQGGSVKKMVELVTELNDRVTLKLLELTEWEMEKEGLGRSPVPYCWMALGSEGRREQTLRTDQDNALTFAHVPTENEEEVKGWFLKFSERVVDGLVRYGFPRCPGGIMASNPRWCQTEAQWQKTFLDWVNDPTPLTLRMASIFFDFRPIYAGTDFLDTLRDKLNEAIKVNRLFLRFMAKNGLHNRPPLGFLRQFVVEKSGEHANELNLKMKGLTPVVDSARVLALDLGIDTPNTVERLAEITKSSVFGDEFHSDVVEAYSFINFLRISHHLEARAKGHEPDNFVDPATLNNLQRKMLKGSFAVINELQELVAFRYQTQFIMET